MKVLIIIVMLCLMGCRTVKTTSKAREEMKKDVKLNTVAVKAAVKETNVLTYWPDGSVYQFEQVKEQMDQTRLGRLDVEEKQVSAQSQVEKKTEPLRFWIYLGIAVILVAGVWLYKK